MFFDSNIPVQKTNAKIYYKKEIYIFKKFSIFARCFSTFRTYSVTAPAADSTKRLKYRGENRGFLFCKKFSLPTFFFLF